MRETSFHGGAAEITEDDEEAKKGAEIGAGPPFSFALDISPSAGDAGSGNLRRLCTDEISGRVYSE